MGVRVGLLGGSFDPVHLAHIALAQAALTGLDLDRVELIPAANPWQRAPLAASPADRIAMLQLALRDAPGLSVNTIEIERGGQTYTADTLDQLPPNAEYYWILGSDQLANFCSWHRWRDIAGQAHLAVAQRAGASASPPPELRRHLDSLGRKLLALPFEPASISSTQIRQHLAKGEPTDGLLDVAVAQYIREKGLYQSPAQ